MSTNLEVVKTVAAMVPRTQWPSKLHSGAIYTCLCDNLATCLDRPELFVTYGKAMAHLLIQSVAKTRFDHWRERYIWPSWDDKSRFIRDAFTDARRACDRLKSPGHECNRRMHEADARALTAVVTVVHGQEDHISHPDEEDLI
jgi:hypothetical protein